MFRDVAVVLDDRFQRLFIGSARLEKLARRLPLGGRPGLFPGRPLSHLERHPERPDDALRRDVGPVSASSAIRPDYSNGNTVDRQGRLVTCEHGDRRVTRTEHDGSITVLAEPSQGKRSTAPTTSW